MTCSFWCPLSYLIGSLVTIYSLCSGIHWNLTLTPFLSSSWVIFRPAWRLLIQVQPWLVFRVFSKLVESPSTMWFGSRSAPDVWHMRRTIEMSYDSQRLFCVGPYISYRSLLLFPNSTRVDSPLSQTAFGLTHSFLLVLIYHEFLQLRSASDFVRAEPGDPQRIPFSSSGAER